MEVLLTILSFSLTTTLCTKIVYNIMKDEVAKDLMDRNQKIEPKYLPSVIFKNEKEVKKLHIPFYNLYKMFNTLTKYRQNKNIFLNDIKNNQNLEYLTIEEKKQYEKDPTLKTVKKINKQFEEEVTHAAIMDYFIDNTKNELYYKLNETNDDIIILKVIGPLKQESKIKIKERILNAWITIYYENDKENQIDKKVKEDNKKLKEQLDIRNYLLIKKKRLEEIKRELITINNKINDKTCTIEDNERLKKLTNESEIIGKQVNTLTKKLK